MTRALFEAIPIHDNHEPLVDLAASPFELAPMYFEKGFTPVKTLKLRQGVAQKLQEIQDSFEGKYQFKIWDAHRPRAVQDAIYQDYWQKLAGEHPAWSHAQLDSAVQQFVTRATTQKRIPPHATGGAVDLTLLDHTGTELNMGTPFDFFGPEAAPLYYELNRTNDEAMHNRKLLRTAMLDAGFTMDDDEWWHYDYGNQLWAHRAGKQLAFYGEAG